MPAIPNTSSGSWNHRAAHSSEPKTFPDLISPTPQQLQVHELAKRQGTIAIPSLYQNQNSSPAPGAVVGIVLGSVAAFLLVIWLFSTLTGGNTTAPLVTEEEVVVARRRSRSPRSRRSRPSEMTSRSPRRERIIRQEHIVRDTSRAPRGGERYIVTEETRGGPIGGNTVEVVEEGDSSIVTAPRRHSSRRRSRDPRY